MNFSTAFKKFIAKEFEEKGAKKKPADQSPGTAKKKKQVVGTKQAPKKAKKKVSSTKAKKAKVSSPGSKIQHNLIPKTRDVKPPSPPPGLHAAATLGDESSLYYIAAKKPATKKPAAKKPKTDSPLRTQLPPPQDTSIAAEPKQNTKGVVPLKSPKDWSEAEDLVIARTLMVERNPPFNKWSELASLLPGRNNKQVRDR